MGFFDDAQEMLDRGVTAAKGAVSGVAVEQRLFVKAFVRMCNDGWLQGWHERNGGNLTYRMTVEEVSSCRSFFYSTPSSWVALGMAVPEMAGEFLVATASGAHMRNVSLDPVRALGIVEVNGAGDAWRIVWGFKDGGFPTSELPSHLLCHAACKRKAGDAVRVMYHAHPSCATALTLVLPPDTRTVTRALWTCMTESVIAFPEGVGVLPWMCPGSRELARATSELMAAGFNAVLWAQHGVFCSGANFDTAFGLMHAIEKASEVYARACPIAEGGQLQRLLSDANLREIAKAYDLDLNEEVLA